MQAGRVLEWIDRAGYVCADAWSNRYCLTAYVGNVHYDGTIGPGDFVEVDARVIHTGKSSIHVLEGRVWIGSSKTRPPAETLPGQN